MAISFSQPKDFSVNVNVPTKVFYEQNKIDFSDEDKQLCHWKFKDQTSDTITISCVVKQQHQDLMK